MSAGESAASAGAALAALSAEWPPASRRALGFVLSERAASAASAAATSTAEAADADGAAPPTPLSADLGALFDSGAGADVEVTLGGHCFDAHRAVLMCRSRPLLKLLRRSGGGESRSIHVNVDPAVDAGTARAALRFLYSGRCARAGFETAEAWAAVVRAAAAVGASEKALLRGNGLAAGRALRRDVGSLLRHPALADLELLSGEHPPVGAAGPAAVRADPLRCHGAVLAARSGYVRALLHSGFQEAASAQLRVDSFTHAALRVAVDFCYTEALPPSLGAQLDLVWEVWVAAEFLQINGLGAAMEERLQHHLAPADLPGQWAAAEMYASAGLREHCLAVAAQRFGDLVACGALAELPLDALQAVLARDDIDVAEADVAAAVRDARPEDEWPALAPLVRAPFISTLPRWLPKAQRSFARKFQGPDFGDERRIALMLGREAPPEAAGGPRCCVPRGGVHAAQELQARVERPVGVAV